MHNVFVCAHVMHLHAYTHAPLLHDCSLLFGLECERLYTCVRASLLHDRASPSFGPHLPLHIQATSLPNTSHLAVQWWLMRKRNNASLVSRGQGYDTGEQEACVNPSGGDLRPHQHCTAVSGAHHNHPYPSIHAHTCRLCCSFAWELLMQHLVLIGTPLGCELFSAGLHAHLTSLHHGGNLHPPHCSG